MFLISTTYRTKCLNFAAILVIKQLHTYLFKHCSPDNFLLLIFPWQLRNPLILYAEALWKNFIFFYWIASLLNYGHDCSQRLLMGFPQKMEASPTRRPPWSGKRMPRGLGQYFFPHATRNQCFTIFTKIGDKTTVWHRRPSSSKPWNLFHSSIP